MDPELPAVLDRVPAGDVWGPLDNIEKLVNELGSGPPVTWLIRSDESVRYATGDFASGYTHNRDAWNLLRDAGHELGWHMHLLSYDSSDACFSFDSEPAWLDAAFAALLEHFNVNATRTGWDFCSDWLMRRLDELGVRVDLSALPGNVAWHAAGTKKIRVDWLRSSSNPYHPAVDDYQRPGDLRILEVPITQFPNSFAGMLKRASWRFSHGCLDMRGLGAKSRMLTERWPSSPTFHSGTAAFYFHPDNLTDSGWANFRHNVATLYELPGTEFVTASMLASSIT